MVIYKSALKIWVLLKLLFFSIIANTIAIVSQPKTVDALAISFSKFLLFEKNIFRFLFSSFKIFKYFFIFSDG